MKDGTAVDLAALEQVRFYFPQLLDVTYFSHTINVGKHFEFRVLDTFACYWVSMFSHGSAGRLELGQQYGPIAQPGVEASDGVLRRCRASCSCY